MVRYGTTRGGVQLLHWHHISGCKAWCAVQGAYAAERWILLKILSLCPSLFGPAEKAEPVAVCRRKFENTEVSLQEAEGA
jgi:hypothetical protein